MIDDEIGKNVLIFCKPEIVNFKAIFLCGVLLPEVNISVCGLLEIKPYLIKEGLLNPEDDIVEELKCPFYKQMIHGVVLDLKIKNLILMSA